MSKGFQLVRPLTITDAVLTSSNVADPNYPAYAAGTTYNLNDYVIVTGTNIHQVYQSLVASNVGNTPSTSPTKWVSIGATNRWLMFDGSVTSQTSNANTIVCTFATVGRIDSVALLNISAGSVTITMTDATDGVVYNKTYSLISMAGIIDSYTYSFEPVVRVSDFAITDMPPYSNTTITITLNDSGSTVLCGACVLGLSKELGGTQYGAKVGIVDYSGKTLDTYGNYTIVKRAFSKRGTFTIWIESGAVDQTQVLLAQYRSTPIVYIGASDYASTIFYGFYKDFDIDISYPTQSVCSITIEGLT